MKTLNIEQRDNGQNLGNSKELVDTMQLIGYKGGQLQELVCVRWYMGRSKSSSVVHCSVWLHSRTPSLHTAGHGKAGGYGYCKRSAAYANALESAGISQDDYTHGRGMSVVESSLMAIGEYLGYEADKLLIVRN